MYCVMRASVPSLHNKYQRYDRSHSFWCNYIKYKIEKVNQQKGVQQDTAYSGVVVNDHMYPRPCLYHFFYDPFGSKKI